MGCNAIDATMCLGLPWLIKTLIPVTATICNNNPSSNVIIESSVLHVNCILLIVSVGILFALLNLNKFRLDKVLGGISAFVYASILAIAISVETYGMPF